MNIMCQNGAHGQENPFGCSRLCGISPIGRSHLEKRPFFRVFPNFSKTEPLKSIYRNIGVQYIKLKLMKFPVKCKRNYLVLINRYAWVRLCIWAFAQSFGDILREFREILGKYRILKRRSVGSTGFGFM